MHFLQNSSTKLAEIFCMHSLICNSSPCKSSQTGVFGVKIVAQGGGGRLHLIFVWVVDSGINYYGCASMCLYTAWWWKSTHLTCDQLNCYSDQKYNIEKAQLNLLHAVLVSLSSDTVHYSSAMQYVATALQSMMVKEHTADYRSWWMGLTSPLWLQSIHQGTMAENQNEIWNTISL